MGKEDAQSKGFLVMWDKLICFIFGHDWVNDDLDPWGRARSLPLLWSDRQIQMVDKHSTEEMMEVTLFLLRIGLTFSWWAGEQVILTAGQMYDYFKTPGVTETLIYEVYLHKECGDYIAPQAIKGRGNISSFEKDLIAEDPKRWGEVSQLLTWLEIPFEKIRHYPGGIIDNGSVSGYALYDMLMDEKRFKSLISKLSLKAFW